MPRRHFLHLLVLLGISQCNCMAIAQESVEPEPLRYHFRFPKPSTHQIDVELEVPVDDTDAVTLMMPVWTPGSYLVREFAGRIESLSAFDVEGIERKIEKTAKNRWIVEADGTDRILVHYTLFAREPSVRTNWVDRSFALINGASTFLTIADGHENYSYEVALELPPGWPTSVTTLEPLPDSSHHYRADNYDQLVDSPILAGDPAVYEFEVDGVPHRLVNVEEGGVWDGVKSVRDLGKIVSAASELWGGLPYEQYIFFNLLTGGGGGIEHKESTVLMSDRWATQSASSYLNWLDLAAHEHFHAWNVKRLRPAPLGPFDYEHEVYTRSLWVAEGITSYYSAVLLRRAGLCTPDEFLSGPGRFGLAPMIERIEATPGRLVQSLSEASFDAWIKFYRPGPNSREATISYYTKGAVVGFLLDAEIRRATDGVKSLDDLIRLAFERYSDETGYTPEEFRDLANEVAGVDLSSFFTYAVDSASELNYSHALEWLGLRFRPNNEALSDQAWHGLGTRTDGRSAVVTTVPRVSPGADAGFDTGDEILGIGELRIDSSDWSSVADRYRPNETVDVLIARRGQLLRLNLTFGRKPSDSKRLERDPNATDEQKAHRAAWLSEDLEKSTSPEAVGDAETSTDDPI